MKAVPTKIDGAYLDNEFRNEIISQFIGNSGIRPKLGQSIFFLIKQSYILLSLYSINLQDSESLMIDLNRRIEVLKIDIYH